MAKQHFIIVGAGYRAMYYVRVAQAHPDEFELDAVYCRSEDKARRLSEEQGLPTTTDIERCVALKPDFAVIAVSKPAMYQAAREWALRGIPVIAETPIADNVDELIDIWGLHKSGRIVYQSAEQYVLRPRLKEALERVQGGLIGRPYHMYLARAHNYHGASLMRFFLNARFEQFTITGRAYKENMLETGSRAGVIYDGNVVERERQTFMIDFERGAHAVYDFNGEQYRGMLHEYALYLDAERGALANNVFHYIDGGEFKTLELEPDIGCTCEDNIEDEAAIRRLMLNMPHYRTTGESIYPLEDALQDSYMAILMKQAIDQPCTLIRSEPMPWQEKQ